MKVASDEFDVTPRKKKKKKVVAEPEVKVKKKKKVSMLESSPLKKKKKRKVPIEEVEEPVKKKKKKRPESTALVVADKKQLRKISKLMTGKYESILGDSSEQIQQLLENDEADSATALIQKRLLQSLVDLLPMAEHNVRKTEGAKGVYQINSLISSIREVMADLQALRDRGLLGQSMVERIVQPFLLDLGVEVVQEYSAIVQDCSHLIDPAKQQEFREIMTKSRTRLGTFINNRFSQNLRPEIIAFLQR